MLQSLLTDGRVWLVALSTLGAVLLSVRVWRSSDPTPFKVVLTLLALIPVLGPVTVYWISNFPSPLHPALRDYHAKQPDVYDRWRDVLEAKSPISRHRAWQRLMGKRGNGK
jgi:hypothetical protein